jgi:predicted DNA-binding transcriptional regulator YafY
MWYYHNMAALQLTQEALDLFAAAKGHDFEIGYLDAEGSETRRVVRNVSFKSTRTGVVLVGRDDRSHEVRTFRTDRLTSLRLVR